MNDKNVIVVIVDQFTKMIRLRAIATVLSLEEISKIYKDDIWKTHGVSRKIFSNRGPQFVS